MTGDYRQDFAHYFDPMTLEELPSLIQIRNIVEPRHVSVSIELVRPDALGITFFLSPVRENRLLLEAIDNEMIRRAYLGPQEGQNSVIGSYGGRYYFMWGEGDDPVIMTTARYPMEHGISQRLSYWNPYAEVDRQIFVQLFREAKNAGFVL